MGCKCPKTRNINQHININNQHKLLSNCQTVTRVLSQIIEQLIQVDVGLSVDALTNQESQFVGILTGRRNWHNPLHEGRGLGREMLPPATSTYIISTPTTTNNTYIHVTITIYTAIISCNHTVLVSPFSLLIK